MIEHHALNIQPVVSQPAQHNIEQINNNNGITKHANTTNAFVCDWMWNAMQLQPSQNQSHFYLFVCRKNTASASAYCKTKIANPPKAEIKKKQQQQKNERPTKIIFCSSCVRRLSAIRSL